MNRQTSNRTAARYCLTALGLAAWFWTQSLVCHSSASRPIEGIIWHTTGVPTLLVTYGVSNDIFFSGHTALAVFGTLELARLGKPPLVVLAILLGLVEVTAVIVLRAHYTMDVFAGAMTALFVGLIVDRLATPMDQWLSKVAPR